jgi:hypothetical protein
MTVTQGSRQETDITDCSANFMAKEGRQSQRITVMRVVVYVFGFLNLALALFSATHYRKRAEANQGGLCVCSSLA